MAKKYLDLLGLTAYDGKIKDYAEDIAETAASNAVSNHDSDVNAHGTLLNGYVPTTRTIAGKALTANIAAADLTAALTEATQSLKGLMSTMDKTRLDDLWAVFDNGSNESFVDTLTEILEIFQNYPEGADLVTQLASKVDKNNAVAGATKTKITYDSKGLVTAGADATLDDIPDGAVRKLGVVPDIVISTSGTGDVVTGIAVDDTNKHKLNITKGNETASITEQEINSLFA